MALPKLHEVLAVRKNLKKQSAVALSDLKNTFEKKKHHFSETLTTFKGNQEGEQPVVEAQLDLQTSVRQEIKWITPFIQSAIDSSYQVAEANTQARADVVLENGDIILQGVPATALLELEKSVAEIREFVGTIPTLDPAKGFKLDPMRGDGIYRARDVERPRTKKVTKHIVVVPPTDKHPAQVATNTEDIDIGKILQQEWSGLISTADKGLLIERVENLARAIEKARSRANEAEVDTVKNRIGAKLLEQIFEF